MSDITKIGASQLSRAAYVYLRQSSPAQVEHNRESTQRQYALVTKASSLGWPAERHSEHVAPLTQAFPQTGTCRPPARSFRIVKCFTMQAALMSQSCSIPQFEHVQLRTDSGISAALNPQQWPVFDVAAHRSNTTKSLPVCSAL
jgi:hypothetical protein